MKRTLSLLLLCFIVASSYAQNLEKKAKRFMKKFGLEEHDLYYVSHKDFVLQYADDGGYLIFPYGYMYTGEGKMLKVKNVKSGGMYSPFKCFQTMSKDLQRLCSTADTGNIPVIIDTISNVWHKKHVKAVFDGIEESHTTYDLYIYFPVGMGVLYKKTYKEYQHLIDEWRNHKEVKLYFILTPIIK